MFYPQCVQHSEYSAKYICVDVSCREEEKIVCAECQLLGAHRKHEFASRSEFKSRVQSIARSCVEYLDVHLNPNRIAESLADRFQVLRIQINELLVGVEQQFTQFAKQQAIRAQTKLSELQGQLTQIVSSQNNDSIDISTDDLRLFTRLLQQREHVFDNEIQTTKLITDRFNVMRVDLISYVQSQATRLFEGEDQSNAHLKNANMNVFEMKTVHKVIRIDEDLKWNQSSVSSEQPSSQINIRKLAQISSDSLAFSTSDHVVRVVDSMSKATRTLLVGHNYTVTALVGIHDKYVITGSSDTSVKVWELASGKMQANIRSHSHEVTSLLVLGQKQAFVSGSKDYCLVFHEFEQQQQHADAGEVIVSSSSPVKFFDCAIKSIISEGQGSSMFIIVGYSNGQIALIDTMKQELLYVYDDPHALGLYCMVSLDSMASDRLFCSAGGDGKLKLWRIEHRQNVGEMQVIRKEQSDYMRKLVVIRGRQAVAIALQNCIEIVSYQAFSEASKHLAIQGIRPRLVSVSKINVSENHGAIVDFLFLVRTTGEEDSYKQQVVVATSSSILCIE